jgi:two-component system, chemotaxis family, response regulator Rcp1
MSPSSLTWPTAYVGGSHVPTRSLRSLEILLVEDSAGDAELMTEALLSESALTLRVTVVEDGEEAIAYLRRQGRYANAPRPDLILLDLYLPRKNGHEVLADVKQDESLRLIPVILLTAFDTEEAIREAYDRHVNCCVRKPSDLDQFSLAVKRIETFWLQMARLSRES